jgi:hypothetical protein
LKLNFLVCPKAINGESQVNNNRKFLIGRSIDLVSIEGVEITANVWLMILPAYTILAPIPRCRQGKGGPRSRPADAESDSQEGNCTNLAVALLRHHEFNSAML